MQRLTLPRKVLARALCLLGKHQRKKGSYNHKTLQLFAKAAALSTDPATQLDYIAFQRDLGIKPVMTAFKKYHQSYLKLSQRQQFLLLNFLIEANPSELIEEHCKPLQARKPSPAIAAQCHGYHAVIPDTQQALVKIYQQKKWQQEFQYYLQQQASIAIIGNSPKLLGTNLGKTIDQKSCTARFNAYSQQPENRIHHGKKLDIWIQSPGLKLPIDFTPPTAQWLVVAGPDVKYTLADWGNVHPHIHQGTKVLTIPLEIWKTLVEQLQAPPSAGLLFITWIAHILNDPKAINIAGFNTREVREATQHVNKTNKTSSRHNWEKEIQLLNQWEQEGMKFLT